MTKLCKVCKCEFEAVVETEEMCNDCQREAYDYYEYGDRPEEN